MQSVRSSLIFSFIDHYGNLIVSTVTVIWLAHILTPEETGLYSIAAALVNIAQALREFGASAYIIQEKDLTPEKLASVTGVCLLIAGVLATVFFVSAGVIAGFYGNAGLAPIIRVLCLNFIGVAYSSISVAQLRRDMRFKAAAYVALATIVANAVVSIAMASLGFGAISLAWGSLTGVFVTVAGNALSLGSQAFVRPSLRYWRDQMHFGVYSTGSSLLANAADRAPDLVVARLISVTGVGLFSRGNGLITLFRSAITSAVDPVIRSSMAAIHREDGDVSALLLKTLGHLTAIAWPALAILAILADPIITIMFGAKWKASVPVAQVLCAGTAISLIGNICQQCLFAIGEVRANFLIQVLSVPVFVAGVAIGSLYGLTGAAIGSSATAILVSGLSLIMLQRHVGVTWRKLYQALSPALLIAIAAAAPALAIVMTFGLNGLYALATSVFAGVGAAAGWLAAVILLRHPIRDELQAVEHLLKRKRKIAG